MWLWWIFPAFFFAFFLLRVAFWRRAGRGGWGGHGYGYGAYHGYAPPHAYGATSLHADETLRQRLAKGEIDVAEYDRLRAALDK